MVDLARSAGLSVQQVRNYVECGMLPPAARAGNGYRVFTTGHAEALTVARIVIDGYGWATALTAMRAANAGDAAAVAAVADHAHAALDRERARVTALLRAFDGDLPAALRVPKPLRIGDAAAVAGVRTSALRVWEKLGLLAPDRERGTGYRMYDQSQVIRARVIALLRGAGYALPAAKDVLDAMRDNDPTRTRNALRSRLRDLDRLSGKCMRATAALYRHTVTPAG